MTSTEAAPLLEAALQFLKRYAKGGANKRSAQGKSKPGDGQAFGKEQLNAHLHNLYAYAWDWGLTKEQMRLVVELFTKHQLNDTIVKRALEALIPQEKVDEECFVLILGAFATFSPAIHNLYGVIFHWIEHEALRPLLCNLLYRMARPQDLRNKVGPEPAIDVLLALYKEHKPSAVTIALPSRVKPLHTLLKPKRTGRDLYQRIIELQGDPFTTQLGEDSSTDFTASKWNWRESFEQQRTRAKSAKAKEVRPSISHFANGLEQLEIPEQAATLFRSPFFHHYVALYPNRSLVGRLTNWLGFILEEEVFWKDSTSAQHDSRLRFLLSKLLDFGRANNGLVPTLERFLYGYVERWNGVDHSHEVLGLLSLVNGCTFPELQENLLNPLTTLFFTSTTLGKARLLECFTAIVKRWTTYDWSNWTNLDAPPPFRLVENEEQQIDVANVAQHYRPLYQLIRYVDRMCVLGLLAERDHAVVQHAALGFVETVPMIIPPSDGLVYRLLFAHTAMPVSRLCGAIVSYKSDYEALNRKATAAEDLSAQSAQLNSYIWDFAVALWRQKLFASAKDPTTGKSAFRDTLGLSGAMVQQLSSQYAPACLSCTHGIVFSNFALEYMLAVEQQSERPARTALHPDMIKAAHKFHYVDFLKERGLEGLYEFLCTFVTSLRQRAKQQQHQRP